MKTDSTGPHVPKPTKKGSQATLMNAPKYHFLMWPVIAALLPLEGIGQQSSNIMQTNSQQVPTKQDGEHDFDFEIRTWKTHLWRLIDPLTGSAKWVQYEGTSVVRKIWNGRANLLELEVDGPTGHIEDLNLRLYSPQSRQWSLNFADSRGGTLSPPTIGEFKNGRGEFFSQETLNRHSRTMGARLGK
jgi:hypothetical protein